MAASSPAEFLLNLDTRSLLITIAALLTTYLAADAIYNLYFHPLRRFPGPRSHAISSIPQFLVRVSGTDPYFHLAQHRARGDVVRVAPDALSFAHPDAWRDIYARAYDGGSATGAGGSAAGGGAVARRGLVRHERLYRPWAMERSVFNASGAIHARQRRVLAPGFSERACREYEPTLNKYLGQLLGRLRGGAEKGSGEGAVLNISDLYQSTTVDIMSDITGRPPTRLLEQGKLVGGLKLQVEQMLYHLMTSLRTLPWWGTWLLLHLVILPVYYWAFEDQKFDAEAVEARWTGKSSGSSANGHSEGAKMEMWKFAPKTPDGTSIAMPWEELKENAQLLMFAGAETTANLLTGTTNFLLRNPEKLEKLRATLHSTFKSAGEMTMTSLIAVDYLNACLKEGLRMHSPAPSNMLRKVPPGGARICGHDIPGGTEVSAAPYAMDHLEQYWRDPWSYEPGRWTGDDERFKDDARDVFQPFSMGPQNCLGMALAWHEARLILANVIYGFDLTLDQPEHDWTKARGLVVWEKMPLLVKVTSCLRK